ncbi:16001_t:CDS:2, partial [Gigaspora rosea]
SKEVVVDKGKSKEVVDEKGKSKEAVVAKEVVDEKDKAKEVVDEKDKKKKIENPMFYRNPSLISEGESSYQDPDENEIVETLSSSTNFLKSLLESEEEGESSDN